MKNVNFSWNLRSKSYEVKLVYRFLTGNRNAWFYLEKTNRIFL